MSISYTYKGLEIIERNPFEFEVPSMGLTLPNEASAKRAIDTEIANWLDGYAKASGTSSNPVDDAH